MNILVTGSAGFIGYHLCNSLLKEKKNNVYGIDNLNNYYSVNLKKHRLNLLKNSKNFYFFKISILEKKKLLTIVKKYQIKVIIHLAAQAGVRYSLTNPDIYVDTNVKGFLNILEVCKILKIKNLIYASTSSVYGLNENLPFKENNIADHPIQLYAATKRANELMAHAYSSLYKIPTTGLRFFTVYGPLGRPDMALFKFTKNILENKKIELFNYAQHSRDFTYIDDIIYVIQKFINKPAITNKRWDKKNPDPSSSVAPYRIYNVSSGHKVSLKNFLQEIEINLNKKAKIKYLPLQDGDIKKTLSSTKLLDSVIKRKKSKTGYKEGIKLFVQWYLDYYVNKNSNNYNP
jgi:UDP-glucuronate 4-epimerase